MLDCDADFETLEGKRNALLKQVTRMGITKVSAHVFSSAKDFIKELVKKTEIDVSKDLEKFVSGVTAHFGPATREDFGAPVSEELADREEERTQTKIRLQDIRASLDETKRQKDKSGAKDRMEKLRKPKESFPCDEDDTAQKRPRKTSPKRKGVPICQPDLENWKPTRGSSATAC